MIKKLIKSETLSSLLWMLFGLITGLDYLNKEEYLICSLLFLIAIVHGYRLVKSLLKNYEN